MRVEPDFPPRPTQPQPVKDTPSSRREAEAAQRARPKDPSSEKDTRDYDDGAWM